MLTKFCSEHLKGDVGCIQLFQGGHSDEGLDSVNTRNFLTKWMTMQF